MRVRKDIILPVPVVYACLYKLNNGDGKRFKLSGAAQGSIYFSLVVDLVLSSAMNVLNRQK